MVLVQAPGLTRTQGRGRALGFTQHPSAPESQMGNARVQDNVKCVKSTTVSVASCSIVRDLSGQQIRWQVWKSLCHTRKPGSR